MLLTCDPMSLMQFLRDRVAEDDDPARSARHKATLRMYGTADPAPVWEHNADHEALYWMALDYQSHPDYDEEWSPL